MKNKKTFHIQMTALHFEIQIIISEEQQYNNKYVHTW